VAKALLLYIGMHLVFMTHAQFQKGWFLKIYHFLAVVSPLNPWKGCLEINNLSPPSTIELSNQIRTKMKWQI
jgi:hypothetical protein